MIEPAVRVDRETGAREEVAYFGDRQPLMFGVTHLPAGEPVGGVVICTSIHAELLKSYRKEALLARALTERGIAVQRYHYRGEGNSEGEGEELTLHEMIDSVSEAREALRRRGGCDRFAYLGTRLGCLAVAGAAQSDAGAPLVMWDPVVDTERFFREVFSSHYIAAIKGEEKPDSIDRMIDRLRAEGSIELVGYRLTRELYDSLHGKRLDEFHLAGGDVFVVQLGGSEALRKDAQSLVDRWTERGSSVTPFILAENEAWWLAGDPYIAEDGRERTQVLVAQTSDWLAERLMA